jgi:hypothetical protein
MASPYQGDDVDPFSGARNEEGDIEREEPKKTFKQAFAEARKAGDKTFMFNGKKYTTEMKGEKKAEPAKEEAAKEEPRRKTPREKFKGLMGMLGNVKTYKSGGSVSSASKRADGCAQRGKTKGRFV